MEVEEEARELVEEKEVFREFLRERARARDVAQAASVGLKGTTKAPPNNKGNMAEVGVVGGVIGGSVAVGSAEPVPKN